LKVFFSGKLNLTTTHAARALHPTTLQLHMDATATVGRIADEKMQAAAVEAQMRSL
jgi:hypothetical protein